MDQRYDALPEVVTGPHHPLYPPHPDQGLPEAYAATDPMSMSPEMLKLKQMSEFAMASTPTNSYYQQIHHGSDEKLRDQPRKPWFPWLQSARRPAIIIAAVVLLLVIVGAVLGGVLGSRAAAEAARDSTPPSPAPTQSTEASGVLNLRMHPQSQLAAVNWTESGTSFHGVFYQAPAGHLMLTFRPMDRTGEANGPPTTINISDTAQSSKYYAPPTLGTSLAATVNKAGGTQLLLYYTSGGALYEVLTFAAGAKTWTAGHLSNAPPRVLPGTRLAAHKLLCRTPGCHSSVIVAYEGPDMTLMAANSTINTVWNTGRAAPWPVSARSGVALAPKNDDFTNPDDDGLRVYAVGGGSLKERFNNIWSNETWMDGYDGSQLYYFGEDPAMAPPQLAATSYAYSGVPMIGLSVTSLSADGRLLCHTINGGRWSAQAPQVQMGQLYPNITAIAMNLDRRIYLKGGDNIQEFRISGDNNWESRGNLFT